ncbi:hypothetical protein ACHAXT_007982 [Thalassiosira profunda]
MSLLKKRITSGHGCSPPESKKARVAPAAASFIPHTAMPATEPYQPEQMLYARLRELRRLKGPTRARHVSIGSHDRDGSPANYRPSSRSVVTPPSVPSPQELIEAAGGLAYPKKPPARADSLLQPLLDSRSSSARLSEKNADPSQVRIRHWMAQQARANERKAMRTELKRQQRKLARAEKDRKEEEKKQGPELQDYEQPREEAQQSPKASSGLDALETLASVSVLAPPDRMILEPPKIQHVAASDRFVATDLTVGRRIEEAKRLLIINMRLAEELTGHRAKDAHFFRYAPVHTSRTRTGSVGSASNASSQASAASPRPPSSGAGSPSSVGPKSTKGKSSACYVGERHPITNLRHGRGVVAYPNGYKYVGEFANDRRHGFGKVWYPSSGSDSKFGGVYQGSWERNQKCGQGCMKYANGDVYEGQGHPHQSNGESYTGMFLDQKKHGFGVYRFANGDACEGLWREDVYQRRSGGTV